LPRDPASRMPFTQLRVDVGADRYRWPKKQGEDVDFQGAATVLAARELLPSADQDLSDILVQLDVATELVGPAISVNGRARELASYIRNASLDARIEYWLDQLQTFVRQFPDSGFVVVGQDEYPTKLFSVPERPPILFFRGNISVLDGPTVAVVGSRQADSTHLEITRALASELAHRGVIVVSGLAVGIDSSGHCGALPAGKTVAVLPSGLANIYPASNQGLAEQIERNGALVSPFSPHAPATSSSFLQRNAIISGLADATIVTRATRVSGTANEVEHSIRQGRPVYFWAETMTADSWASELVEDGYAFFLEDVDQLLGTLSVAS
jgi:DNA protecting protein DprA